MPWPTRWLRPARTSSRPQRRAPRVPLVEELESRLTPSTIKVFAGGGTTAPAQATSPTAAQLSYPWGVAADGQGDLFIADRGNSLVYKVDAQGHFGVFAGGGTTAPSSATSPTAAKLNGPSGIAVDGAGDLYITDFYNRLVEKVDAQGHFSVFAGGGATAPASATSPTAVRLSGPTGVATDTSGNVYIADAVARVVLKVDAQGHLIDFAGGGTTAPASATSPTAASLSEPFGVAADASGDVYIADPSDNLVEKVDSQGHFSVFAGGGTTAPAQAASPTDAGLSEPVAVAADASGDVYIADYANNLIEKVDAQGKFSVLAGGGTTAPAQAASATDAALSLPLGVAVDGTGGIYISDSQNALVELVNPTQSPSFTGLSAPGVTYGAATGTLSGTLAAGSTPVASATVSVTVDGVTETATTGTDGSFHVDFPTAALGVSGSPYTVTFAYAGGPGFNPANDTSRSLTVSAATPTVTVTDAGGTFTGSAYAATAASAVGVRSDGTLASLGNPSLSFTYYAGGTATGTPLAGAPINAGTYTVVAHYKSAGANYADADSVPVTFNVSPATPTVTVVDAGGTYNGSAYPATAAAAVGMGSDGTLAALGSARLSLTYYAGATATGTPLSAAPVKPGTYTVVAHFASGSPNYASSDSAPVVFDVRAADANTNYVVALYRDVLARAPEAFGLKFWVGRLNGGASRSYVAGGIWDSPEHRGDEVDGYYSAYLHRPADGTGRAFWVGKFLAGADETAVVEGFLTSNEYQSAHAADAAFVGGLFGDVLDRTGSPSEASYWTGKLATGVVRAAVADGFVRSAEGLSDDLATDYSRFLHRQPDALGQSVWMSQLTHGGLTLSQLATDLLASDEYYSLSQNP